MEKWLSLVINEADGAKYIQKKQEVPPNIQMSDKFESFVLSENLWYASISTGQHIPSRCLVKIIPQFSAY